MFGRFCDSYRNKKVYVMGHERADFDTLVSAYLVSRWLSRCGVDAEPVMPDTAPAPDDIPQSVMLWHGVDVSGWTRATSLGADSGVLFLVDCHTPCIPLSVAAVIDHHPTAEPIPVPEEFCVDRAASSCALLAYRIAKADGIDITDDEEILTVRSVYMDTQSLLSAKFDPADKPWLEAMIKKHRLDAGDLQRRGLCFADFSRRPEELALDWLKYYTIAGKKCASSHIQAENIPDAIIDGAVRFLTDRRRAEGIDIWIFFVAEPLAGKSRVIELSDSGVSERRYERFLSRSKDIIPELERRLSQGLDF